MATPGWKLLAPVPLQTLCLRHEPEGLAGEALDRHTLGWADTINRSGKAYLTPAILDGRWMVRVSIGALPTEREHVEALWRLIREEAEAAAVTESRHCERSEAIHVSTRRSPTRSQRRSCSPPFHPLTSADLALNSAASGRELWIVSLR